MISTVTTGIIASLLSLTSAGPFLRAAPGEDCWYSNYYCSNTAGVESVQLGTGNFENKTQECYDLCKDQAANATAPDLPCLAFTLVSTRGGQHRCYFLTEPCEKNSADQCFTSTVKTCTSGPADCGPYNETTATCPKLPALGADYLNWNCKLGEQNLNPYTEVLPVDTLCWQTCPSWKTTGTNPPRQAQLESTCEMDVVQNKAVWSDTVTTDNNTEIDLLKSPYPKPDADASTALKCGCLPQELPLKWPYDPTGVNGTYYDPNAEEAAEFICKNDLETAGDDWTIKEDNSCTLYCDNHYVATAECVAGEWTGNPEWGFWCYEEPKTV